MPSMKLFPLGPYDKTYINKTASKLKEVYPANSIIQIRENLVALSRQAELSAQAAQSAQEDLQKLDDFVQQVHAFALHTASTIHVKSASNGRRNSYSDVEDIAQDATLRAFNKFDTFNNESAFTTWLHTIVLNKGRNNFKKHMRAEHTFTEMIDAGDDVTPQFLLEQASREPDVEHRLSQQENAEVFLKKYNEAFGKLSAEQRRCWTLRHEQNHSQEEVARLTNTNLGTVTSRLSRARNLMRQHLQETSDGSHGLTEEGLSMFMNHLQNGFSR